MRNLITALVVTLLVFGAVGSAEAGWEEGVKAFQAGNYSAAAKEFQEVVESNPDYASGHFMLGQALAQLNRDQDALAAFRKAYDLNPNSVQFQFALANAYLNAKRYGDASQLYERIDPSSLGAEHRAAYQTNKAIAFDKSGRGEEVMASLRDAARSRPNDAKIQYSYGVAAYNAGDSAAAVTALGKAVQLDPNPKHRGAYVKALVRQAREDRSKKANYPRAAEHVRALVSADPSYENLLLLGEVQLGAKQYRDAVDSFKKASAQQSNDWLALFYLSQAQTAVGDYADAERTLGRLLQADLSPENERRVYKQIGFVHEKLRKYDEAKVAYARAGDQASIARIEQNEQISAENQQIEEHNRQIEQMRSEQEALEEELRELEESPPPVF